MESQRLFLAFLLFFVTGVGVILLRRRSPLHPMLLALGTTLVVGTLYPVLSMWIKTRSWRHALDAPVELIHAVQLDYLAYGLAMLVSFMVLRGRAAQRTKDDEAWNAPSTPYLIHRDRLVSFGLVAVGLGLYALYVVKVGVGSLADRENFALKYQLSGGLGPLVLGLHLAIVGCFWAEGSRVIGNYVKRCYRFIALAIALWSMFVIAQRTNIVILGLGYGVIFCEHKQVQLRRVRLTLVALLAVLYISMELFGIVRATWKHGMDQTLNALAMIGEQQAGALGGMLGGSELAHPVYTSLELMQMEEAGALAGQSYIDAPLTLVPRTIISGRPNTLAQDFVADNYPAMAARGGGAAFSLVGEAWWNFGAILGPALLGLFMGAVLSAWDRASRRRPWGLITMLTPYLSFHIGMIHRYEAATFLKQTLSVCLPALLVLISVHLIWTGTGRSTRVRQTPAQFRLEGGEA